MTDDLDFDPGYDEYAVLQLVPSCLSNLEASDVTCACDRLAFMRVFAIYCEVQRCLRASGAALNPLAASHLTETILCEADSMRYEDGDELPGVKRNPTR